MIFQKSKNQSEIFNCGLPRQARQAKKTSSPYKIIEVTHSRNSGSGRGTGELIFWKKNKIFSKFLIWPSTAVQLVFNPFSQLVPQLELYSQLQLSLWSDPIAFSVPKPTYWVLVKIKGAGSLAETQMKKWWKFEYFLTSLTRWKVTFKTLNSNFRQKMMAEKGENAPVYRFLP